MNNYDVVIEPYVQFKHFKETSSTTIAWGIAYLINHPSVIEKAHAELDKAIGVENNRLVTVADKTNLPYINAIINVSNFIIFLFF